jgi:hypothetical protein
VRLQVFVRQRAQRRQAELLRQRHVAGAGQLRTQLIAQRGDHFLVPGARKPPARAVIGDAAVGVTGRVAQQGDLVF